MEGIQVSVEKTGTNSDISIIRVGGYIDTTTSSELERALDSLLKAGIVRVIIDLGNVDYISSAGWGIFISEIKGIRERNGDLKLVKMIPDVYEVFELLEFHYILKAFDSIDEAVVDFDRERVAASPSVDDDGQDVKKSKPPRTPPRKKPKQEKPKESLEVHEVMPEEFQEPDDFDTDMSIEEKIRNIILENPGWGPKQVSKELNSEKYGYIRIGTVGVWKLMRKMDLGSKKETGPFYGEGDW